MCIKNVYNACYTARILVYSFLGPKNLPINPPAAWADIPTVELIPICATVYNDGACNNECVIHYEGTTDTAQQVPSSPGMDSDPSATIESFTVLPSKEIVDEDTSRVIYAAPRDSVEQGAHIASEKDTAMPVV